MKNSETTIDLQDLSERVIRDAAALTGRSEGHIRDTWAAIKAEFPGCSFLVLQNFVTSHAEEILSHGTV